MRKRAALLLLIVLALGRTASGQETPLRDVYNGARRSVVLLITFDSGNAQSLGSGVTLTPDGEIATNLHVVDQAKTVSAKLWNGSFLPIDEVIGIDQKSDLVILKADAQDLPAVQLATGDRLAVGDSVIAIGNPLGLENALSTGVVSGLRQMPDRGRVIQTTAPISPGSSGGGIFDQQGKLVGITFSTLVEGQNLNFAIPVDDIKQIKRFTARKLQSVLQESAVSSGNGTATQEDMKNALRFMAVGMYDDAQKELANVLATDKFNAEAHLYLGDILVQRNNFDKALEEFKIAANLAPNAITPRMRISLLDMALLQQQGDNSFRRDAIVYLRQVKDLKSQIKEDEFANEEELSKMTADVDSSLVHLLRITGEWTTPEGGVWKFTESDGPAGKKVLPNTGIVTGPIAIRQAYSPTPLALGFMWRNGELDLEGWYGRALPEVKCNASLSLSLRESEDGMILAGTSKVIPPSKPPKGCTYSSDVYPINLTRK